MSLFAPSPSRRQRAIGLLLLRLALGAVFLVHGGQKLFMLGMGGTTGMLAQLGVPSPSIVAPLLMIVEPLAGLAIVLGILTRVAALAVAVDMSCAIALFHIRHGFFVPMGVEFVMMLAATALALVALGAGPYSVDDAIARRRRALSGK